MIASKIIESYKRFKLLKKAKISIINKNKLFLEFHNISGFYLPYGSKLNIDRRQLFMVSKDLSKWLLKKYTKDNVQLKKTDIVIDCGAFVGGFSIAAANFGVKTIYSIEPSSKNYDCLKSNITYYNYKNCITPLNVGLDSKEGELKLNLSKSGCDDSFLKPDEGDLNSFEIVKTTTLKNIIEEYEINPKNLYLKVEAEGFEPEVILGLKNYTPRVIVVDISSERDGLSPIKEIESHLQNIGYVTENTKKCLFAYNNLK